MPPAAPKGMTPRFLIVQTIGAAFFLAAWWKGWPQQLYAGDPTRITALIAAVAFLGLIAAAFDRQRVANHITLELPILGLLGTFVGLQMAVEASGGDFDALRAALGTAFNTTICGIVGALWLRLTKLAA